MTATETPESIASVTDRVRTIALPQPATAVHFLGDAAVFIGGEESAMLVAPDGEIRTAPLHGGAILCAVSDGKRVVTGGDDGKVVALGENGESSEIAIDPKRRWIDAVAVHPEGAVAWSAGKTAFVRTPRGDTKSLDAPSTVGGLAFAPKGLRLAIAHYNGATLWFPNMAGAPERLTWAGSHLAVTFSPDNRFLVTAMHEAAMHGWRLADGKHMRMSGYPSRVRSMAWTATGKALATSGADTVILWPFVAKDGPMGKEPAMLAPLSARVTAVACHPRDEVLAAGYSNGTVLLVRLSDGAEILVHRNEGGAVSALNWNAKGAYLAFATEDGSAGVLAMG